VEGAWGDGQSANVACISLAQGIKGERVKQIRKRACNLILYTTQILLFAVELLEKKECSCAAGRKKVCVLMKFKLLDALRRVGDVWQWVWQGRSRALLW